MVSPQDPPLRYPGGRRALWGLLGTVIVYAIILVVTTFQRETLVSNLTLEFEFHDSTYEESISPLYVDFSAMSDWDLAGIVFYNAHFAPLELPGEVVEESLSVQTFNLVTNAGGPLLLLLVVPVVVYTATGAIGARNEPTRNARGRALSGMFQFTGVFPAVLLGLFLFTFSATDGPAGPSPAWGMILAGLIYPAVCGLIGGYLVACLQDESGFERSNASSWGD